MTEAEWMACEDPDQLLEFLEGRVHRNHLVALVRASWRRIAPYLPPVPQDRTVVEEFAEIVDRQSDHDAVVYASEAILKAARLAPDLLTERKNQAVLLRQIVGDPFRGMQTIPSSTIVARASEKSVARFCKNR